MLLLLVFWSILLLLSLIISDYLGVRQEPLFTRFLFGLAIFSLFLHLWALFLGLQWALIPVSLVVTLSLATAKARLRLRLQVGEIINHISFKEVLILALLLYIAVLPGYINDEPAYYQQTIKWLSEYGYVDGLANLKIHLGLASSWHLISSVFYLDEIPFNRYYNFNGLLLLVFLLSMRRQFPKYEVFLYSVVLIPGSLLVNAPTPDLVILCGTFWILVRLKEMDSLHLAIIIGFLITVKLTAAGLIFLIPVMMFQKTQMKVSKVLGVIVVFGVIIITKNIILSGHPFFPLFINEGIGDHNVPVEILYYFQQDVIGEIYDKFHVNLPYDINTFWGRVSGLFAVRSYKVIMNILSLMAFIITPLLLFFKKQKIYSAVAIIILIIGIVWFWQAPYYRFVLGFIVYMFFILYGMILKKVRNIYKIKDYMVALTFFLIILVHLNIDQLLFVVNCGKQNDFNLINILYPVRMNEVNYESNGVFNVTECSYCYDLPLPCYSRPVMEKYVFTHNFNPVLVDVGEPAKGFIMKKIDHNP